MRTHVPKYGPADRTRTRRITVSVKSPMLESLHGYCADHDITLTEGMRELAHNSLEQAGWLVE